MARPYSKPEKMTAKKALALALLAVSDVAADAPDLPEWTQAGAVIRRMLDSERANGNGHNGDGNNGKVSYLLEKSDGITE